MWTQANKMTQEEKSNPEIKPIREDRSMPVKSEYSMVEQQVMKMQQNKVQNQQYVPDNPIDTAHLLLSNSDTSDLMLEMDKEIKLANLDATEKYVVYQFNSVWNDIQFLKAKQHKRLIEAQVKYGEVVDENGVVTRQNLYDIGGEETILATIDDSITKNEPEFFDAAGTYKKTRFVATLSRGKGGFERIQQIKTISEYKMEQTDITEKSPGFMQKFMGGFKR